MAIDFSKSDAVQNDVPRVINNQLVFGHWSDRHQDIRGQESCGDYITLEEFSSWHTLVFHDVSGEPHLSVVRFEGQKIHPFNGVVWTHAIVNTEDGEFAVPISGVRCKVPANLVQPELAQEWAKQIEAAKAAQEKREAEWAASRQAEKARFADAIESAKSYRPTRQERKWLRSFVSSNGRKATDEIETFMKSHGIYIYGWSEQISLIKEIWGQPESHNQDCDCSECFNRSCAEIEAREQ